MRIIGIAGPSCSGKSSLADRLSKEINAPILSVDKFWKFNAPKIEVYHEGQNYRTFERKELYDGAEVANILQDLEDKGTSTFLEVKFPQKEHVQRTLEAPEALIVEGFLAFTYEDIFKQLDYKYYVDVSDEEILKRRAARGGRPKSDEIFKKIGLMEYKKNGEYQKDLPGVVVLDGNKSLEDIVN